MRKINIAWMTALLLVFGCTKKTETAKESPKAVTATKKQPDFFKNEFVFAGNRQTVEGFLKSKGLKAEIQPVTQDSYDVRVQSDISVQDMVASVKLLPGVEFAEPNFRVSTHSSMNTYEWPNDKFFFKLWAMNNIGQSSPFGIPGVAGADIGMIEAWKKMKDNKTKIKVAVIDTGIDYTHPDLKDNMWINEKEAPANGGQPGVDDDGNGYTDDVYGYNFVSGEGTALWHGKPGGPDPMDDGAHGTHVSGTIAGVANGQGVVGVAPNNVQLMALKFLGEFGGSTVDAVRAIDYAIMMKADLMSNSWGGGDASELLGRAIVRAGKAGLLFVAAAGNENADNDSDPHYPASYTFDPASKEPVTNLLSVGASDNMDNRAVFSNYGHTTVHVFAPGVNILSSIPVSFVDKGEPPYAVYSGTSMATPHVSGVAALMMAADPSLRGNPAKLIEKMVRTSDQKASLVGLSKSNGRVNAARAVSADDKNAPEEKWLENPMVINQRQFASELVDVRKEIKVENAQAVRVHFDFVQVDEPFDSIYLYDKNYRLINRLQENQSADYWSPVIPGDTVIVRFVNSKLKSRSDEELMDQTEASCLARGAKSVAYDESKKNYRCMVESASDDSTKVNIWTSYNSEGYSIDRVAYVPAAGIKGAKQ